MSKILLVEDDLTIAEPLTRALSREGYDVWQCQTGGQALATAEQVDLLILDLGLPDMDGLDVARSIRQQGADIPILILTARADEVDLVVGLDAGADDYMTKPFRLAELQARVRALLRRAGIAEEREEELSAQDIRIDVVGRRVFQGERELRLTVKEFDLLVLLVRHAGTVVSRDKIMNEVWDADESEGSTKTLDMHISWLRRKLGDEVDSPHYIITVRGLGFRFDKGGLAYS